jgi:hypothetical protein
MRNASNQRGNRLVGNILGNMFLLPIHTDSRSKNNNLKYGLMMVVPLIRIHHPKRIKVQSLLVIKGPM